jgi:hypothetical protein
MLRNPLLDAGVGRRIAPSLLAPGLGCWGHLPRRTGAAESWLAKRQADTAQIRQGALRALPAMVSLDNPLA